MGMSSTPWGILFPQRCTYPHGYVRMKSNIPRRVLTWRNSNALADHDYLSVAADSYGLRGATTRSGRPHAGGVRHASHARFLQRPARLAARAPRRDPVAPRSTRGPGMPLGAARR